LTGLAMLLNARGAFADASALLDRAERLSPGNPDVFVARAQGFRLSGHPLEAEASYARARTLSPNDSDIEQGLEHMRRLNRHRVEASFYTETVTQSAAGAHAADVNVDLRATEHVRFQARMQAHTRVSQNEARAGGGVEWRLRPGITVRGSSLVGPGADVIARSDTLGEIEHARGPLEVAVGLRYMTFATADVWIAAPAGTLWLNDRTAVTLRYYGSRTAFRARPPVHNHSGALRLRHQIHPRIWLDTAYSRGFESFEQLSTDRLGLFRADTVSGGVLCHLPGLQSLAANVDYQRRSDERTMVRVTAAVTHRF
jgi:YaiO family outer membrane protein